MRQQIVDIVEKHLIELESEVDGLSYFHWLGRPLDEEEFPAVIMKDLDTRYDDESGHTLSIEVSVIMRDKVSSETAKATRELMQEVSGKFRNALDEMMFFGKLRRTKLDAESSEYQYIQGVMLFEIDYTAYEWIA